jgi:formate--tetrahydrofolate ligase
MNKDLEIARKVKPKKIQEIAAALHIDDAKVIPYGHFKAKLPLDLINEEQVQQSNLILVSAISPTPAGEGKTTTVIGLHDALNKIGKQSIAVLREPSLGPVFGMKGGAAGGGHSQVIPMEDINLHFTGDFSAIEKAHNLLSAMIDNRMHQRKTYFPFDPRRIYWKIVMDMNDRSLRNITVGKGGTGNGVPRETGFDITAASEVMAILCMSKNRADLKERLGKIFLGFTYNRDAVYAKDLKANGAMTALLKDAILPNMVQTLEHNPVIIHGGPFANIAQGTNTIIGTKMGMSLADYTVTEAGFGFDLGGEKFLDIKCREAGIKPKAVVIVATLKALKYHGNCPLAEVTKPNKEALAVGLGNLEKHLENAAKFGLKAIVAINHFTFDTEEEINMVKECCNKMGVSVHLSQVWEKGGEGAIELAKEVCKVVESKASDFKPIYDLDQSVESKINIIATEIYGAQKVQFASKARINLKTIDKLGLSHLPICIAKTQYSFSDNPKALGRAKDFIFSIREIEIAAGAGFLVPIAGSMMRMPGLPAVPASENIDIDDDGNIIGLF